MKTAFTLGIKRFFVCIAAGLIWPAAVLAVPLPDFTCFSAAGDPSLVEVRYTSADGLLFVKVSKPPGSSARIPYPGYMTVNTADITPTGFVLTASRPLKDTALVQAAAIPSAYGPYTVTGHFNLKINVYQRWIRDVNLSNCTGYPQS